MYCVNAKVDFREIVFVFIYMVSYVQNTREPDFATLKAIAKFFHVSIDYLLDNHTGKTANHKEDEILRIFRSLEPAQQDVCIEQCRVFVRMNHKEKVPIPKSS